MKREASTTITSHHCDEERAKHLTDDYCNFPHLFEFFQVIKK